MSIIFLLNLFLTYELGIPHPPAYFQRLMMIKVMYVTHHGNIKVSKIKGFLKKKKKIQGGTDTSSKENSRAAAKVCRIQIFISNVFKT